MNSLPALYIWQCLKPDYVAGCTYWKERPRRHFKREADWKTWNTKFSGKRAGCLGPDGYRFVTINGKHYLEHRLIWVLASGRWPTEIDHINQDPSDNRLENLREATRQENKQNGTMRADNASGVCGVRRHKYSGKWEAYIQVDGRKIHLGLFERKEHAIAARKAADEKYGYHENHGKRRAA